MASTFSLRHTIAERIQLQEESMLWVGKGEGGGNKNTDGAVKFPLTIKLSKTNWHDIIARSRTFAENLMQPCISRVML